MKKVLSFILVLTMVFAFATTAFAQTPESYDFTNTMELRFSMSEELPQEVNMALAMIGGFPIVVESHGTVVAANELQSTIFIETGLTRGLFTEPFRMWFDLDFNNLQDPVFNFVLELPETVRGMLSTFVPELNYEFISLDLSSLMAASIEEYGLDIDEVMSELFEEFGWDFNSLEEADAYFLTLDSQAMEAMFTEMFQEMYAELGLYFAFENFVWEVETNDDDYLTSMVLGFDMVFDVDGFTMTFGFTTVTEITNINLAEMPAWPELNSANSLNLAEMLEDMWR